MPVDCDATDVAAGKVEFNGKPGAHCRKDPFRLCHYFRTDAVAGKYRYRMRHGRELIGVLPKMQDLWHYCDMAFRYLLFDADNTILDFSSCEKTIISTLVHEFHLPERAPDGNDPVAVYREINGNLWRNLEAGEIGPDELKVERFRRFLEALGADGPGVPSATELNGEFIRRLSGCGTMVPGAKDVLERFGPVHVVTNGFSAVQRSRITVAGLDRYIAGLHISEEIGFAKPDVRFFDAVFSRLKTPDRSECLIIGDSLTSDIQGGKNAGIATCWFDRGSGSGGEAPNGLVPDYRISGLGELASIIRR